MSINALYSTSYTRTLQTLKPLSVRTKLQVQEYAPFNKEEIEQIIEKHKDQTIVFSGHSNTIPAILNFLTGKDHYKTFPEWQYDDLHIVTIHDSASAVDVLPLKYGRKSTAP
jgi:broad specificity phosphatase PhoE